MKPSLTFSVDRFFELSVDLCCIASSEGAFLQTNPRFGEVLGYSSEELAAHRFLDFVHEDDLDSTQRTLKSGLDILRFKNRYRTISGDYKWVSWSCRVLPEEGLIYAKGRDITEAEEARTISKLHELWLKKAERMAGVGHWRLCLASSELFWSREIYAIHGLDPREYTPDVESAILAYHPEDRERVSAHVQAAIETGEPFDFRCRIVRPDGSERLVWSRGERLDNEAGEAADLFGVFTDLTEQVEIQRSLETSEARYHQLYARTPAMLHSIDAQGRLLEVSEFWQRKMGYSSEEVLGRRSTEFLSPESQELASRILPEFMKTGVCQDVPYRFVRANGEEFDVLLSATAERDEEGRVLRSMAVSVDVTERLRAERALRESHDTLLRQSEDLREMAIAASHDLKAPVRNVQMFTALALEECEGSVAEHLKYVQNAAERLHCIAEDLTNYMSLDSRVHTRERVDLQGLLNSVLEGLQGSFPSEPPSLKLAALPPVFGVRQLLYSLFENVFTNALKFRREDTLEISLELEEAPEQWVFILQDNGLGIEEAFQEDVFKLFKRLNKGVEGTGAGLAIAKKIVELHGGTIRFLPCSQGARLRFTLPKNA